MSDPRWNEVFRDRMAGDLPTVPKVSTPLIRDPQCPAHCTGNHGVEATIGCAECKLVTARLIAHEWYTQEGHYFYTREAVPGYSLGLVDCPGCQHPLGRMP